jgi:hypothetical protein
MILGAHPQRRSSTTGVAWCIKAHPTAQAGDPAGRRRFLAGPNAVAVKNELLGEREVRESLTEIQGSGLFTGAQLGELLRRQGGRKNGNGESSTARFGPAFMQHYEVCTSR